MSHHLLPQFNIGDDLLWELWQHVEGEKNIVFSVSVTKIVHQIMSFIVEKYAQIGFCVKQKTKSTEIIIYKKK